MISGLLVVDKPSGWTSHDVVARLRRVYEQRRIGHAGTLDPDATGVLLVGLGRVTRLLRYLQEQGKVYRGEIGFGVATDTLDASGNVLERTPMSCAEDDVRVVMARFVGPIEQVPPMVSAVKIAGRKLYELARAGETVERAPRAVRIERFELESFTPGPYPQATVLVECSTGTYIRTLAADLGAALGGAAHLSALRRLRVGSFDIDEAVTLEAIEADPGAALLAPAIAVRGLPTLHVEEEQARAIGHGAVFPAALMIEDADANGPFAVLNEGGELLAVYGRRGAALAPEVVVSDPAPAR